MASFELTGVVLVLLGFALIYLGVGLFFNALVFDRRLSLQQRFWLTVGWPNYTQSNRSVEEKRKAREIEVARQADMRRKRRGF